MPSFDCDICRYSTSRKSNYNKHLLSNKHVNNVGKIMTEVTLESQEVTQESQRLKKRADCSFSNHACHECFQKFTHKNGLYRHRKHFCKGAVNHQLAKTGQKSETSSIKCKLDMNGDTREEQWKTDLNNLLIASNTNNAFHISHNPTQNTYSNSNSNNVSKKSTKLSQCHNNIYHNSNSNNNSHNINSNNTNSNNNVQQNIVVNNFNKDNWDHVSDKEKIELLKNPRTMIKLAFKKVNLNKDVPQNHNIRVENRRSGKVLIWEDEMWRNEDKDGTLRVVVDEKYYILDSFFKDLLENNPDRLNELMTKDEINAYTRFSKKFDEETNLQNVNHPDRQPLNNQFIEDCFYSLVDELINAKKKKQEENEKKEREIEIRRNERRRNTSKN